MPEFRYRPRNKTPHLPGGVRPGYDPCTPVYAARSGWPNGSIEQQSGTAMSQQKITDEQWADARKRYETEPGLGLGKIAQVFDCSKSLVARKAREGKWQKDFGVPNQVHPTAREREAKVTESAVPSETQAVHVNPGEASTRPSRVVADVFVSPGAAPGVQSDRTPPQSTAYADEIQVPADLDEAGREEWVKQAIVARQRSINGRHLKELNAARSKLYESLKAAGSKEGAGTALASQRNVAAMLALQQGEMDAELQRVRLEVAEFVGAPLKPAACRIVVHMMAGEQLIGGARVYGPNAIEVTDVVAKDIQ